MNQIAIVVHTCDRYQLLYQGFEYFFKKYWPHAALNLSYYFFTEEADHPSVIFKNIKTGKGEWSHRLLRGLKQIPEPCVIYFQEDMWLSKPVDGDTLKQLSAFVVSNNVDLFKLSSNPVYYTTATDISINGLTVGLLDNAKSKFLMSHQVSIWKKTFLMAQLNYKEHPWRNERRGTKRLKKLKPTIFHIDLFSENWHPPVNNNENPLAISQYSTVSQNAMLNGFVSDFIDEMKADAEAPIRQYADKIEYHFKNSITHDGKSKPRKDDVFKKIKNFIKGKR